MKDKQKQRLSVDQRKLAMMAAARELFIAKGYAATSLDEIVAKSGGSLTTLYQLFGNKAGIWRELVHTYTERVVEPFEDSTRTEGPPRQVLRDVASRLLALQLSPDAAAGIRIIMAEGSQFPDLAQSLYDNGPLAGRKFVAQYLKHQVEIGTLRIDDIDLAAGFFFDLVNSDYMLWSACGLKPNLTPAEIDRRLDAAVNIFLKSYERAPE